MNDLEIWIRYFLIWPSLRPIGNPADGDVITIQAYGRNSIPDAELYLVGQLRQLIGNDWLTIKKLRQVPIYCDPGEQNFSLALECQDLVDRYHLPIITQWEVAAAFGPHWYKKHKENVFCVWPPTEPQVRFSTYEVKEETKKIMKAHGWKKPIELAHKRQIVRNFLIVRKLINTPIITAQKTDDFDPGSVQKWTRRPGFWFVGYEPWVRAHHILNRWVIKT
jgi:hypothetical protein